MKVFELTFNNQNDLANYLRKMEVAPQGVEIISQKLSYYCFKITEIKGIAANILKQEALSLGAECALPHNTLNFPQQYFSVLLLIDQYRLKKLITKLQLQQFKVLQELSQKLSRIIDYPQTFNFKNLTKKSPLIMGILNVTPDSFSDQGQFYKLDDALNHCRQMVDYGADIIDIGGESTRPGSAEVSLQQEQQRVLPVIQALKEQKITLSIDTSKSQIALQAAQQGVEIINDISGFQRDPQIAEVAAQYNCHCVLMHRSANSLIMQKNTDYQDLIAEIIDYLEQSIQIALKAGVKEDKIILDPGIGFGKTLEQNLTILKNIKAFRSLGFPVLLGVSRKSMLGSILSIENPLERDLATAISTAHAIINQVDIVRVHDVAKNVLTLKLINSILRGGA